MTPRGFRFSAVEAAVKAPGRLDLGLIEAEHGASVAGVFTRNRVQAAPVVLCRERTARGLARAVLVNAGNANACTGEAGLEDARALTAAVAERLGAAPEEILPCSTGVIGQRLPVDRITGRVPELVAGLGPDPEPFARSILTTDTFPKMVSRTASIGGGEIRFLGIAKGAGMIRPDMATMLAFVLTDAAAWPDTLRSALGGAVERTFNRITVDGDTSTNDTVLLMASGGSGVSVETELEYRDAFAREVEAVCAELARMIVRDGEGAGHVVEVRVRGAADEAAALSIARTVAESPLVKTAVHGRDPNWGRIAAALGRAPGYRGGPFHIAIGGVPVVRNGLGLGAGAEARAAEAMGAESYEILVELEEGRGEASVLTCDLSAEYVRINADYRS